MVPIKEMAMYGIFSENYVHSSVVKSVGIFSLDFGWAVTGEQVQENGVLWALSSATLE